MQCRAGRQVGVRAVEVPGQQLRLAADGDREGLAARCAKPVGFCLERIREERETAAQLSDFDDYEIGNDADGDSDDAAESDEEE